MSIWNMLMSQVKDIEQSISFIVERVWRGEVRWKSSMTVTFTEQKVTVLINCTSWRRQGVTLKEKQMIITETAIKIQTTDENVLAAVITTERAMLPLQRVNKLGNYRLRSSNNIKGNYLSQLH